MKFHPNKVKMSKSELDLKGKSSNYLETIEKQREAAGSCLWRFHFRKKRVRLLSSQTEVKENCSGIVYWMNRDCRVQDNWAFLFAQKLALKNEVSLHVCFSLVIRDTVPTPRQYKFLIEGLQEVAMELETLNIPFHLMLGSGGKTIPKFVKAHNIGCVVCDFSPLKEPVSWVTNCKMNLPNDVPLCIVDAHNIVPVWEASDEQEDEETIHDKINQKLDRFLQEFPKVQIHPYPATFRAKSINWKLAYNYTNYMDTSVDKVNWAIPGYSAGMTILSDFIKTKLDRYRDPARSYPKEDVFSYLSPWLHFGHIAPQRVLLEVNKFKRKYAKSVSQFQKRLVGIRELCDNYCYYNEDYDNVYGAEEVARRRVIPKEGILPLSVLEAAGTKDVLWNSAQNQMKSKGIMHGYLRKYWAAKLFNWTKDSQQALDFGNYLNNKYSLDASDPCGYAGMIMAMNNQEDYARIRNNQRSSQLDLNCNTRSNRSSQMNHRS